MIVNIFTDHGDYSELGANYFQPWLCSYKRVTMVVLFECIIELPPCPELRELLISKLVCNILDALLLPIVSNTPKIISTTGHATATSIIIEVNNVVKEVLFNFVLGTTNVKMSIFSTKVVDDVTIRDKFIFRANIEVPANEVLTRSVEVLRIMDGLQITAVKSAAKK